VGGGGKRNACLRIELGRLDATLYDKLDEKEHKEDVEEGAVCALCAVGQGRWRKRREGKQASCILQLS